MPNLQTLGVRGKTLPTIRAASVQPADFSIGGIVALFSRQFAQAFLINNLQQLQDIFRSQKNSAYYGWDAVTAFFNNVGANPASLYVVSHAGYTGSAIDAVQASASIPDTNSPTQNILTLGDGYQGVKAYGTDGNNTGYQIEVGSRFTTTILTTGTASDTFVYCTSVADMNVGDQIKVVATGGGGATVYKVITAIDTSTGKVSFSGAFHATANAAAGDAVTIPGFRIHTYRTTLPGVTAEVDTALGQMWLTIKSAVTKYYAPNVFAASPNLTVTVNSTTSPEGTNFPAAVSSTTFLASGANGTTPTTAAHWSADLLLFDGLPVRFLANPETTTASIQTAIQTYAQARDDTPIVIYNGPSNQTKAQLITIGNNFQNALAAPSPVLVGHWLGVTDPFNPIPNSPDRYVPNVGHVMGVWVRSIAQNGIHYIPCTADMPLFGVNSVYGTQFPDDQDRTDLANAGVNCIDSRPGFGIMIRNLFSVSTDPVYQFANAGLMVNFIKVSAKTSLASGENTPATLFRAKADGTAVLMFMLRLWKRGSTGNVPEGETFAQSVDSQGNPDGWQQHVLVQADEINNPQSQLQTGVREVDVHFSFPAPTGTLIVGVGIYIPS